MNPIDEFLERQGTLVLDGGLGTALQAEGVDVANDLWSATAILDAREVLRRVHRTFLEAGADCIATCTYQATPQAMARRGLTAAEATRGLLSAVDLAVFVRDAFHAAVRPGRARPLVAASIGPYGAFLADGSEYSGRYGLSEDELYTFHADRFRVLAESSADLIACETIPSLPECRALLRHAEETGAWMWMSFSCRDSVTLHDGNSLPEAVQACDVSRTVAAVGVNCVPVSLVESLIETLGALTDKPIVVYPNAAGTYDPEHKVWEGHTSTEAFGHLARTWREAGAACIGGCCGTDADTISRIRAAVLD